MGYLGRRIGLSQDSGDSNPGGADGAVGGGILDLFAQGYFNREGNIFNNPAASPTGISASGGVINDYSVSSTVYRAHIFTASGTFEVSSLVTLVIFPIMLSISSSVVVVEVDPHNQVVEVLVDLEQTLLGTQ